VNAEPAKRLLAYIGKWQGTTKTWFEPGVFADESFWQGEIIAILGDRFLEYSYTGSLQDTQFQGKALIGPDPVSSGSNTIEMAWIDSFHQSGAIMYCQGEITPSGFSVLGSYSAGVELWGWRTEFELIDTNHLTVRAYNISPDGAEHLGIETVYSRS
jgi:hypothetical protein